MTGKREEKIVVREAIIASKIITIREEKVILDVHLLNYVKLKQEF